VALIILDASIVIAWLESTDVLHAPAERVLGELGGDDLRLPVSAYAEVLVGATRRGKEDAVKRAISDLSLTIEPMTTPIAEHAAGLRATRGSLSLPDAFVLATAETLAADRVLTADTAWWGVLPSVDVIS
jgi:predicted nucleic acid-binding protein